MENKIETVTKSCFDCTIEVAFKATAILISFFCAFSDVSDDTGKPVSLCISLLLQSADTLYDDIMFFGKNNKHISKRLIAFLSISILSQVPVVILSILNLVGIFEWGLPYTIIAFILIFLPIILLTREWFWHYRELK